MSDVFDSPQVGADELANHLNLIASELDPQQRGYLDELSGRAETLIRTYLPTPEPPANPDDPPVPMRGRYPKHPWPDDPLAASATARAKPRGG